MTTRLLGFALLSAALVGLPARADEKTDAGKEGPFKVPFEILLSRHMTVQVKVNGKGPYRLVFDTGAPLTIISSKVGREAGIIKKGGGNFGLFGGVQKFPIKEFEVGGLIAEDATAVVMDHPTVQAMAQILGPIEGIVGFPFFARYRMTIDYQAKEMLLEPVDYKPTDIMDMMMKTMMNPPKDRGGPVVLAPKAAWGLVVDKGSEDEEAGVDIKEVLMGGAAERAGLKVGDRVLTLDGRWTDSIIDLYEAATHVKPGATVPVRLRRGSEEIELLITPAKGL